MDSRSSGRSTANRREFERDYWLALFPAVWNMQRVLRELKQTGSVSGFQHRMINFAELNELLQPGKYPELEFRRSPML